jgi:hypothetical protein
VRAALAGHTLEQCRAVARAALDASSAVDARAAVSELLRRQAASVVREVVESQPA